MRTKTLFDIPLVAKARPSFRALTSSTPQPWPCCQKKKTKKKKDKKKHVKYSQSHEFLGMQIAIASHARPDD